MSFSIKKFSACLAGIALTLLTACSGQSATDTLTNGSTSNQTSQTLSFTAPSQTNATNLLDSLAVLYPNANCLPTAPPKPAKTSAKTQLR